MFQDYTAGSSGPQFNPYVEASTTAERWRSWKRNFQYYIDSQIGLNDKQKVARLLHQAGPEVQEIYDNIEDEDVSGGNTEYEKCIKKLDLCFEPEKNINYERQKFRNLQMEEENIEQFIIKLRKQARYCEFPNKEEAIKDQLIEKCSNVALKVKLLKKGKDLTLNKAMEIARLYEIEQEVVSGKVGTRHQENNGNINKVSTSSVECFRCGRKGHFAKSAECSAAKERCNKCGILGHFAKCCRTKISHNKDNKKKKRIVRYVVESCSGGSEDSDSENDCESSTSKTTVNSVFVINEPESHGKYVIKLGDQVSLPFLIDSGASVDIVDRHTFRKILKSGLTCELFQNSSRRYYAYGGSEVPNMGFFKTTLYSPDSKITVNAQILVFDGCAPSLLSKKTSIQLGLLRVGPEINCVTQEFITKDTVSKEYPEIFNGIGKLKDFKLTIPVDPNVKLIAQPIRRQPFHVRDIEQNLIKELLDNDIIEPVVGPTPCVSPSHIVKKKEQGQYRLVVDMRKANEAVQRERVPLPTFEELLADLNGCKYFSTIDLKSGYHQLELDESSRIITVFSSSRGLFRYKRLFFGIRCASEMFQRVIAHLLQDIEGVANSQDDIRVGGRTRQEHDLRLRKVLDRLHGSGITLNEKKCSFGVTEITFLGHHISADGVRPTSTNQQVVQDFRAPQNREEVRSFLGLVNFSARFIPNFSSITGPLRELTKKDSTFCWGPEHQRAFDELKTIISSAPALGFYDKDAETILITDASPIGIAGVLVQKQVIKGEKQSVVIKYISKALSPTEQRYSQTEKEALSIVWSCENLYMYLIGKEFKIISDHKPLEVIYTPNSKPCARIQRWVLRLQPFTYKVIYKPGKNNIADAPSRLLDTSKKSILADTEDEEDRLLLAMIETSVEAVTIDKLKEVTLQDEELSELKNAIEKDHWTKELRAYELMKSELCIIDGIILRGTRPMIPKQLIPQILEIGHEGHLSANSMKAKLRCKVWWKNMDKDIEYWCDTCEGCRLVGRGAAPEPIIPTELPTKVWQLVGIDYLGPLPSGHYLLCMIDYYSRYFEVEIMKHQTAEVTIQALEKIICREGIMDEIVCDNGPAFIDQRFKEFLKTNGIRLRHTTPLWPQANGEIERQNRNILRRLRIAQSLKQDWKKELLVYLSSYRTTPHSTTGLPPGDVFRGRSIKTKLPELAHNNSFQDEGMRDLDKQKKDKYKQYADKRRHAKESDLHVGDKVLVRQKKENKLSTPFSPTEHTVIWKSGNTIAAQAPEGKIVRRNSSHFQPIKDRDLSRFGMDNTHVTKEVDKKREMDMPEVTLRSTPDMTSETLREATDNQDDLTDFDDKALPKRQRQTPAKYRDFVLSLILECMHN